MIARSTDGRSGEAPRPLGHDRRRRDPQPSRLKERQRAFDAIDRCLDLGDPHRPSIVLFEADPGLGKSAMLNAAATSAAHAGWSVHVARTAGVQSGVALAARVSDTLASAAADVRAGGPVLIGVDDARCLSDDVWPALLDLCAGEQASPVVVVLTAAPRSLGERTSRVDAVAELSVCEVVRLAPLSTAGVAELVAEALGQDEASAWLVAAVQRATTGNPLLVHRALQVLPAAGTLQADVFDDAPWPFPSSRIATWALGQLPDVALSSLDVLRAVAVLRDDADVGAVRAVAAALGATDGLDALLDDALTHGVLVDSGAVRFRYPIVAESLYADIPRRARSAAHHAAAAVLRGRGRPVEAVARHLLHVNPSGDEDTAATLLAATRDVLDHGDVVQAEHFLQRAAEEPPTAGQWAQLLALRALVASIAQTDDPAAILREAFRVADEPAPVVRAGLDVIEQMWTCDSIADVVEVVTDAAAGRAVSAAERVELDIAAALLSGKASATHRLADAVERAAPHAATPDHASLIGLADVVSTVLDARDPARCTLDRILALAPHVPVDRLLSSPITAPVLSQLCELLERCGEGAAVDRLLGAAASVEPMDVEAGWRTLTAAELDIDRGALLAARATLLALADGPLSIGPEVRVAATARLSAVCWLLGEERAERQLPHQSSVRRGPRTVLWSQLRAVEAVGFHHLVHRDPLRAVDAFDIAGHLASAAEISNPAFTEWRVGASIAWSMRGEPARGRVLAEQSLELAERFGGAPIVERSLRALALAVDGTERVDLLRRAADMMEDHPFALVRCMVFLDLGAALAATGDVDDAVEWLRRGGDLAVQLGAHALMDRAHDRLLQAGARPRRLARSGVASLTRSELRVAALAAEGRTNSAIAAQLYVSLKTVESHLGKVYRKMQVSGRSELMECWSAEAARVARQRTE